MRVPSQRSHERLQYNRREERSGLQCTSCRPARFHRSAPRMRPRIRATRASSPTSEMPRIGGRYFNREKSGDVPWVRTGSYRPRIRAGYVVFFKKLFGSPAGFGFARRAASLNVRGESAYPNTPNPRRYCLASATSSTTSASRSVRIHLRIHACGAIFTLCARAIVGRVALMLLPAYAVRAFCNLLIGTKMRART